ncbi:MAG TPA: LysE family translocator [Pseudolabrys sp.]|jgi:threonine/homoserine/homoserine lactone efflux protein|nr:LysE family translocator [Pseudolabrys sp.]
MLEHVNLWLILGAGLMTSGTPGPANIAIAGTSMNAGRRMGLALASGVTTISLMWSITAASGLAALMLANAWIVEVLRYVGAGYLLFLGLKSAKSALTPKQTLLTGVAVSSARRAYVKGMAIHLTNPKAILFFGSVYSLGVPITATFQEIATVVIAVGLQSALIFHGYALLFSSAPMARAYVRARRWFEAVFAAAFVLLGLKILSAKLQS